METQIGLRPASTRQLEYIRKLRMELGEQRPLELREDMSSLEASRIINHLIARAQENGAMNGQARVNEPRSGWQ